MLDLFIVSGAGNGIRTRDLQPWEVDTLPLSYSRVDKFFSLLTDSCQLVFQKKIPCFADCADLTGTFRFAKCLKYPA